jgi:hypothetical protein
LEQQHGEQEELLFPSQPENDDQIPIDEGAFSFANI